MEEKDEKEDLEELYKDKGKDDHDDLEDFFEEVKEDEKKDNKMLFIIGGVILGIILLVVILLLVFGGSKNSNNNGNNGNNNNNNQNNNSNNGKEENNKNDDLDEDEIDNRERIPRTEKKMIVYMIGNEFVEDSYVKEEDRKNKATVGINIEDLDAKVLDIYPRTEYKKGEFPKYILYLDAGKVKYFSVSEFKSRNLAINATYNKYRMLVVEDSFKAIYYKKAKENGIYNLSTKKYLYKDTYKSFAIIGDNLLEAEKKDDTKKYTLLLSEEKVIGDSSDGSTTVTFGKFMAKVKDGLYTVYDSKYNVLAEGIKENEIYQDGDTICVAKKGTVYKYDLNGKELDHSIGNDEIAFITKDYYVSVNGTGFKLMELVGSYPLMDEQMNGYVINPKYSGLKDKSDKSSQTGKGIYIYLEGTTVDKEYFYNLNTGESSSTKINK